LVLVLVGKRCNPEDASRRRLEAKLAEHVVTLSVSIHTPYAAEAKRGPPHPPERQASLPV